jgi:enoyl-CoA hydratase/carnithine racemase
VELKATRLEVDRGVATVWLHRPHRHNGWTGRMYAEYRWIFAQLEGDPTVRAVIVTGTPPAFCVGADTQALEVHAGEGGYEAGMRPTDVDTATPGYGVREELDHDFAWHYGLRLPVIAAVNGACAGIGLSLAMFSDLRFASAKAKITTSSARLGLPAEYGLSWVLPRLVGVTRAADLLLSARVLRAAETADWGLWNGVADDGDGALELATARARQIADELSPASTAAIKRQLYDDVMQHDVGASIEEFKRLLERMMAAPDFREGVAALREKRPPNFG